MGALTKFFWVQIENAEDKSEFIVIMKFFYGALRKLGVTAFLKNTPKRRATNKNLALNPTHFPQPS